MSSISRPCFPFAPPLAPSQLTEKPTMNVTDLNLSETFSDLLLAADVDDLAVLTDYLTDKGEGRLMLDGDVCKRLVECKRNKAFSDSDRFMIAREIRAFGGNSLVNLFRGGGVEYSELARD